VVLVLVLLAVAGVVGYGWYRYNQIGRADLALADAAGGVQNFLVVGSDTRSVVDPSDPDYQAYGPDVSPPRSDTIMVARVDPSTRTVDLVSFPRDLWVPIEPTGEAERINTAYNAADEAGDGAQRLIDTIKADFGIDINHYVEIDFASFKGVVDAVGGVPMYFDRAVRDRHTGFYQTDLGCQVLDGAEGLDFARSRNMEYLDDRGRWVSDPSADLGRITRQQYFLKVMVDRASASFGDFDLRAINDVISSTSDQLRIDSGMDLGEMASLVRAFQGFSGEQIRSHALPVYDDTTSGGARILRLDAKAAEPVLNVFRGLPEGYVSPSSISLSVSNGSGAPMQATDVTADLVGVGYDATVTADATSTSARTVVRYAPGYHDHADQVARQLAGGADLELDEDLTGLDAPLVLVTGTDFTSVLDRATPPTEPPPSTAASSSTGGSSIASSTPPVTVEPGEVTTEVGYRAGEPPPGVTCD
jgi:LCP family protein required for cell wall assembly